MLVQSWGGIIRVFPAVPDAWKDITVHDFQTEGAFTVSAVRKGGVTSFVRVRSDAGEPCKVRPGIAGRLAVRGQYGPVRWRELEDGVIEIDLDCDDEVVIFRAGTRPDLVIAPVPISAPGLPWGLQPLPPVGESVPLDLAAVFNNDGVSPDGNRTDGDFEGGFTYPVEDLPPAGPVTYDGVAFAFPAAPDGAPNNVVARRQVLAVPPGRYAKLRMLGAGGGGNVRTTAVATYADGTTGEVPIELSNWTGAPFFHEAEILRTRRRHGPPPTNGDAANAAIFHQVAALDPSRELRSITLPNQSRLHLFALTLERPLP
jgi:alpha-L-fucosidase 2